MSQSWCGLSYGEQDLDYSLVQVEGKGQGILAKILIPANIRIMVDGFGTESDGEGGILYEREVAVQRVIPQG